MKRIQLLEITTIGKPELRDKDDNIIQAKVDEVSQVYEENGFRYEEDLCLSKLEPETTEVIKRTTKGAKVPTIWEKKDPEEKENHYFGFRMNAYQSELDRISKANPIRNFVVRIIEPS